MRQFLWDGVEAVPFRDMSHRRAIAPPQIISIIVIRFEGGSVIFYGNILLRQHVHDYADHPHNDLCEPVESLNQILASGIREFRRIPNFPR